jgi:diguanylate cyclase (GGDEF)-like protein
MEALGSDSFSLRDLFARRQDPYEGADLPTSRRIVAAMLGLTGLLTLAFLPLDHPSTHLGWRGWLIAAALIVIDLLVAKRVVDRSVALSFNALLVIAYCGVVQIVVLEWLAGGGFSAYGVLGLAWLGAGCVHPPRRSFPVLAALIVGLNLPLFYEAYQPSAGTQIFAHSLLLGLVGTILTAYLHMVRHQRVDLREGAEVARRLARVDELTGLGNRRAFDEALTFDVARFERDDERLSVGLIDLDGLKKVNDGYGHLEGDRCLRELARVLERSVRVGDTCFRWAGDEFAVLLPGTDRETALRVLDRVATNVRKYCKRPDGQPLEISYGAGQLVPELTPEDLLELADEALMSQKALKRR